MYRRHFLTSLCAVGSLALVGCRTAKPTEYLVDVETVLRFPEKSVVFGRVRWFENGAEREIDQSDWGWNISPILTRLEDDQPIFGQLQSGGHFRWPLPAGQYVMNTISMYVSGLGGAFHYAPKVTFQVPEIGRIYYAGTLRADLSRSRRNKFRGEPGTMSFSVHDDYVSELQNFRAVTGIDPNQVEKRLMAQHAG